jgi:DNA polymerase-3 subunit alpha
VAWTTAWLKARQPLAFWTATLNHHGERNYSAWVHVEEAKRAGLLVLPPCVNRSRADWTQEVTALRAGLGSVRTLGGAALLAVIEERERSGPYGSLAEFRRRLQSQVMPQDLALLVRAGAFDAWGRGREVLLREAEAGRWKAKHAPEPWPLEGLDTSPAAGRMAAEWDLLGFAPGPPLLSLARRLLPPDLHDSRALPLLAGRKVRLAGLVAHCREGTETRPAGALTLLDEHGLVEVALPAGVEAPGEAELVLVEGAVEVQYGAPLLRAARVSRVLPGSAPVAGEVGAVAAA